MACQFALMSDAKSRRILPRETRPGRRFRRFGDISFFVVHGSSIGSFCLGVKKYEGNICRRVENAPGNGSRGGAETRRMWIRCVRV